MANSSNNFEPLESETDFSETFASVSDQRYREVNRSKTSGRRGKVGSHSKPPPGKKEMLVSESLILRQILILCIFYSLLITSYMLLSSSKNNVLQKCSVQLGTGDLFD